MISSVLQVISELPLWDLQLLERERKLFVKEKVSQPDLSGYEYIIGRQLKPEIPVGVLKELRESGIKPSSMIDVTDGLASDLLAYLQIIRHGLQNFLQQGTNRL